MQLDFLDTDITEDFENTVVAMVCPVNTNAGNSLQVGLASTCPSKFTGRSRMKPDMHGLTETVPTSGYDTYGRPLRTKLVAVATYQFNRQ